ncbi:MAG: xanthine dehydrogenase family protein subunit M [Dehalococcoidia bacterium]|nr:xanthine dehydrogenase family protein subunit M [Dehalococcoidia bacterium]
MAVKDYIAPSSVDDAVAVLSEHGADARPFAGGTDLIIQVRERRRQVGIMLDVKKIPELMEYSIGADGSLRVGAAVACARLYNDAEVARRFPALIDSASLIGGIQIQSRASLGGNLCNSSPAGDSIPTLIALGATCEIAGRGGRRTVPVESFCTGPGANVLQPGELLVSLTFPAPAANSGAAFERFIPRNEMDIAVANAAANVTLSADGATFTAARIAIGAVAPTALLVAETGAALAGKPVSADTIAAAAAAARAAARPITDMRGSADQRRHLAGVLVTRVIEKAVERARKA